MADRRLQVFHAVAKHLSFTRAADALFMSQPAVTFQIRQLEEEHNVKLFERHHGLIALTAAGALLLPYAEKILALSSEAEARIGDISGEMQGLLLIGVCGSLAGWLLPGLLSEFNALYPRVRVRLLVANSETIEHRVAEHHLELGLVDVDCQQAGLVAERCGEEALCAVCAPDYPLAAQSTVSPADLPEYEYISREPGSGSRRNIEAYLKKNQVDPENLKTQMELGSPEILKSVVASGLGFSIMSRASLDKEIERGELLVIPLLPAVKHPINLIYPQERFQLRVTSTFIEFAKRKLRELVV